MWPSASALLLAAAACGQSAPVGQTPTAALRIVGYNDMDEMLAALTSRYAELHPGVRFELVLKSTRTAPAALADGSAALAPMGAAMTDDELAAFRRAQGRAPIEIHVAHDSLAPLALSSPTGVIVGRAAPLRAISLATLRRVFTEDSDHPLRWRDLGAIGGPGKRPAHLVGLSASTAIGRFVLGRLGASRFATSYQGLGQSRAVADVVAGDPDAIGIANLNHVGHRLRALDLVDENGRRVRPTARNIVGGRYPLDRQLLIYAPRMTDGRVDPETRSFLLFALSREGQRLIARGRKGYLPLNRAERRAERKKLA